MSEDQLDPDLECLTKGFGLLADQKHYVLRDVYNQRVDGLERELEDRVRCFKQMCQAVLETSPWDSELTDLVSETLFSDEVVGEASRFRWISRHEPNSPEGGESEDGGFLDLIRGVFRSTTSFGGTSSSGATFASFPEMWRSAFPGFSPAVGEDSFDPAIVGRADDPDVKLIASFLSSSLLIVGRLKMLREVEEVLRRAGSADGDILLFFVGGDDNLFLEEEEEQGGRQRQRQRSRRRNGRGNRRRRGKVVTSDDRRRSARGISGLRILLDLFRVLLRVLVDDDDDDEEESESESKSNDVRALRALVRKEGPQAVCSDLVLVVRCLCHVLCGVEKSRLGWEELFGPQLLQEEEEEEEEEEGEGKVVVVELAPAAPAVENSNGDSLRGYSLVRGLISVLFLPKMSSEAVLVKAVLRLLTSGLLGIQVVENTDVEEEEGEGEDPRVVVAFEFDKAVAKVVVSVLSEEKKGVVDVVEDLQRNIASLFGQSYSALDSGFVALLLLFFRVVCDFEGATEVLRVAMREESALFLEGPGSELLSRLEETLSRLRRSSPEFSALDLRFRICSGFLRSRPSIKAVVEDSLDPSSDEVVDDEEAKENLENKKGHAPPPPRQSSSSASGVLGGLAEILLESPLSSEDRFIRQALEFIRAHSDASPPLASLIEKRLFPASSVVAPASSASREFEKKNEAKSNHSKKAETEDDPVADDDLPDPTLMAPPPPSLSPPAPAAASSVVDRHRRHRRRHLHRDPRRRYLTLRRSSRPNAEFSIWFDCDDLISECRDRMQDDEVVTGVMEANFTKLLPSQKGADDEDARRGKGSGAAAAGGGGALGSIKIDVVVRYFEMRNLGPVLCELLNRYTLSDPEELKLNEVEKFGGLFPSDAGLALIAGRPIDSLDSNGRFFRQFCGIAACRDRLETWVHLQSIRDPLISANSMLNSLNESFEAILNSRSLIVFLCWAKAFLDQFALRIPKAIDLFSLLSSLTENRRDGKPLLRHLVDFLMMRKIVCSQDLVKMLIPPLEALGRDRISSVEENMSQISTCIRQAAAKIKVLASKVGPGTEFLVRAKDQLSSGKASLQAAQLILSNLEKVVVALETKFCLEVGDCRAGRLSKDLLLFLKKMKVHVDRMERADRLARAFRPHHRQQQQQQQRPSPPVFAADLLRGAFQAMQIRKENEM